MVSFTQEAWGDDHWVHQTRDDACTRDDGSPSQVNANWVATGGQTVEQVTVRVSSRQSRLDNYLLTTPGGTTYDYQANMSV